MKKESKDESVFIVMDYISLKIDFHSVLVYLKTMVAWQVERLYLSNSYGTRSYTLENGWQYVHDLFLMLEKFKHLNDF